MVFQIKSGEAGPGESLGMLSLRRGQAELSCSTCNSLAACFAILDRMLMWIMENIIRGFQIKNGLCIGSTVLYKFGFKPVQKTFINYVLSGRTVLKSLI